MHDLQQLQLRVHAYRFVANDARAVTAGIVANIEFVVRTFVVVECSTFCVVHRMLCDSVRSNDVITNHCKPRSHRRCINHPARPPSCKEWGRLRQRHYLLPLPIYRPSRLPCCGCRLWFATRTKLQYQRASGAMRGWQGWQDIIHAISKLCRLLQQVQQSGGMHCLDLVDD